MISRRTGGLAAGTGMPASAQASAAVPGLCSSAGASAPGAEEAMQARDLLKGLQDLAEEIKRTSFRVTRTGELIGRYVAEQLELPFGNVDLSLAPTPDVGDSVGEILQAMGVLRIGPPGATAASVLTGLSTAASLGRSRRSACCVCSDSATTSRPSAMHASAHRMPGPPALVTMATRLPVGSLRLILPRAVSVL